MMKLLLEFVTNTKFQIILYPESRVVFFDMFKFLDTKVTTLFL